MYNRYIPAQSRYEEAQRGAQRGNNRVGQGCERDSEKVGQGYERCGERIGQGWFKGGLTGILGDAAGGLGADAAQTVKSILKTFHLENIDIGDILLALIVLFLILEDGDNLDLIITLGLMILFSLGDS